MSEEYLKEAKRKFEDIADVYRRETNEIFRDLVQQLILVGTVFLTVSAFVFNIKNISTALTNGDKIALSIAWILIAISLLFGIIQFIVDYYYFRRWTMAKSSIVGGLYSGEIDEKNIKAEVVNRQKISDESCTAAVWLQISTLGIGIILLVIVMIILLFSL